MRNLFWCFLFSIFFTSGIFAQPDVDTTFAGTGKIVQGGALAGTDDLVLQPDNKVVLFSSCSTGTGSFHFCALRYNENGTRDNTFGGPTLSGFALINIPGISVTNRGATGGAMQSDGKFVLVGFGRVSPDVRLVMIRLNSNGSLDTSFGSGGVVQTDIMAGKDDRAEDVAIQPDGKIAVVGYIRLTTNKPEAYQQFFARYLADGTLDSSFGDGGIVRTDISEYSSLGKSIVLQTDGKIIAGGYRTTLPDTPSPSASHMLTRLNPDGSPDVTWNEDGVSTVPGSSYPDAGGFSSLAIQSDGRVVAIGNLNFLYRFNPDGSLDTGFDGDGSRSALNGNCVANDVTISAGGRITVVGQILFTFPYDFRVARYLPDGSPDTGFSEDGFLEIPLDNSAQPNDAATRVAADSRGRIVIAGYSGRGLSRSPFENPLFSVTRLLAPIVPVSIAGRVTTASGSPVSNITVALGLGGTTIAISRTSPFGYYSFQGVMTGQSYTVSIKSRGVSFPQQNVFVADEIENLDIAGAP